MACAVRGCKSHSSRNTEESEELLTFHRFPKNDKRKTEWVKYIKRHSWTPTKYSRICSKHFTLDSFVSSYENTKWRRLNENAVPTLNITEARDEMVFRLRRENTSKKIQLQEVPRQIKSNQNSIDYYAALIKKEVCEIDPLIIEPSQPLTPCRDTSPDDQVVVKTEDCEEPGITAFQIRKPSEPFRPREDTVPDSQNITTQSEIRNLENKYIGRIAYLELQLEKSKETNKRRYRKINTLTKRLSRVERRLNFFIDYFNRINGEED